MARLADPPPVVCSVCHQPPMAEGHRLRYVDFEVAFDGPVVTRYGERVDSGQTVPYAVEWLIICEKCLKAGAHLIGLEESLDQAEQRVALEERIRELELEVRTKDRAISDLNHTVTTVIDHPVKRPARAPKIVGPDSHAKELKTVRSNRRRAKKVSEAIQAKKQS